MLNEIEHKAASAEIEDIQGKLEQLKSVLEMYGHFSGINRKVQMKYQPKGRPRGSSSDNDEVVEERKEPSLVLILKWGGELTPAGRIQAEELGRIFRCMYPGGQGRHISGDLIGTQGLGLLRLHSTFRHDLKIYASDEGRVQMTAAAFAKGLLALEGELTPILVQMVKSANTNGLLDNDCDASKQQNIVKTRLHSLMQQDREFTPDDRASINPCNSLSIGTALDVVKNPVKCCERVHELIRKLMNIVRIKKDDPKTKDAILYHGETWELMGRRWGKIEKDFFNKNNTFDISKVPDIYDCIKYDLQHNQHTLQFDQAEELYINAKYLADVVIPQEYGLTMTEKLIISQGICTPLLRKIKTDLQRNIEDDDVTGETVNRLNPRYSDGVSSPGRHVRTRLYFTSESHIHSLINVLRFGGLVNKEGDEQWSRAMDYASMISELNYMSQIVIMLYEDPTKALNSEERFHIELHFSPGVNCCVQKNLPPGPGFRPHSRNEHSVKENAEEESDMSILDSDVFQPISPDLSESPMDVHDDNAPVSMDTDSSESLFRSKMKISEPIPIMGSRQDLETMEEEVGQPGTLNITDNDFREHGIVRLRKVRLRLPDHEHRSRSYDQQTAKKLKDKENVEESNTNSRWHRHSIGHMNYLKDSSCADTPHQHNQTHPGHVITSYQMCRYFNQTPGSTNSLFSTAVISGSSSTPNLRDILPTNASVSAAIEGCGGVPAIRPLETLHNSLSFRQLDAFLERMISNPTTTPPKDSSVSLSSSCNASSLGSSLAALKLPPPDGTWNATSSVGMDSCVSTGSPSSPNKFWDQFFAKPEEMEDTECDGNDMHSGGQSSDD